MDKNKKGRPKKDENEKKNNRIHISLCNKDFEYLNLLATKNGLTRSEVISRLISKENFVAKNL